MSKKANKASTKQAVKAVKTVSIEDFQALQAELTAKDELILDLQRTVDRMANMASSSTTGIQNKTGFLRAITWISENMDDNGWIEYGVYMRKYGFSARHVTSDFSDIASKIGQSKSFGFWFMVLGILPVATDEDVDFDTQTLVKKIQFGIKPSFKLLEIAETNCVQNAGWRDVHAKKDQVELLKNSFLFGDDELYPSDDDGKRAKIDMVAFKALLLAYCEKHQIKAKLDKKVNK